MKSIAIDFETSYTKDRSIGTHGTLGYLAHQDTDIFMVAIVGEGIQYVGPPEDAPWDLVRGNRVIAHNYSFEWAVIRECERRGIIKEPLKEIGFCTANLAAYLQAPRNLLDASRELLGIQLDKTTRDKFKNKNFHTLPDAVKEEIRGYALLDAKACHTIWEKYAHLWPEHEQLLSWHTTMMGHRGIPVNSEAVDNGIRTYKEILWGLEKLIPWAATSPVLSLPQLRDACRKAGIPAPESTAKDSEEFQVWADTYADKVPFVAAVSQYRSTNRSLGVLEAMQVRTLDDRVRYGLKYCGAVPTFRWSGDTGLNVQNLPRDPVGGIDIRTMFEAPAGKSFISADMSQIEPRVTLWLTGNTSQLGDIRQGMCVYEVHARQTMGYDLSISLKEAAKKEEKYARMRQAAKARVLGLSYGQYSRGFQAYAKTFGLELTIDEAEHQVKQFRAMNPLLVKFRQSLELGMKQSRGSTFKLENPNGRTMQYFDVTVGRNEKGFPDYRARTVMGGVPTYYTAGKLMNNCLSGSTEVNTPSGWKPLVSVLPEDLIWDGLEYVSHEGLLAQGEQPTILVHGVQATPDHKFLTSSGWLPAEVACNLPIKEVSSLYGTNKPSWKEIWSLASAGGSSLQRRKRVLGSALRLREDSNKGGKRTSSEESSHSWVLPPMHHLSEPLSVAENNSWDEWNPLVYCMEESAGSNPEPKMPTVQKLWWSGYSGLREVAEGFWGLFTRHGRLLGGGARHRPNRQRSGVLPRELPLGFPKGEQPQQEEQHSTGGLSCRLAGAGAEGGAEVVHSALSHPSGLVVGGDNQNPCGTTILRANPRTPSSSRSQGGFPLSSDCQFSQGEDGSRDTGEALQALAEEFDPRAGSRSAPDRIAPLHGSPAQEIGLAPRALAETCQTPVYDLLNCGPRHRFVVRAQVGAIPLMVSNCSQGIARDVFAEKITEIEYKLGLPVVLTVHDEVLVEVDAADAKDAQREISRVMATAPQWMPDIPLASDCNIMQAYEK
jgi:DNA polymerase I-like protein with 3'-5' exonuclease and polymerase domains